MEKFWRWSSEDESARDDAAERLKRTVGGKKCSCVDRERWTEMKKKQNQLNDFNRLIYVDWSSIDFLLDWKEWFVELNLKMECFCRRVNHSMTKPNRFLIGINRCPFLKKKIDLKIKEKSFEFLLFQNFVKLLFVDRICSRMVDSSESFGECVHSKSN